MTPPAPDHPANGGPDHPAPRGADPRVLAEPRSRGVSLRHLLVLLAIAAAALLLDAHGLASWTDSLPDSLQPLKDAAIWWDATTTRLGLAAPYDALHRWVRNAISAPF